MVTTKTKTVPGFSKLPLALLNIADAYQQQSLCITNNNLFQGKATSNLLQSLLKRTINNILLQILVLLQLYLHRLLIPLGIQETILL